MKQFLLILLTVVAAAGIWLAATLPRPALAPPLEEQPATDSDTDAQTGESQNTISDTTDNNTTTGDQSMTGTAQETLPAYLDIDFVGTGLTIVDTLATTNSYTRYQISYLSNGIEVSGIMNVPNGEGPYPLLVLNHGYIDPAVYTNGRGLKREQDHLARNGYIVIHTDYRGHAFSDDDPSLEQQPFMRTQKYGADAINAVLAAKNSKFAYIDTNRVGMLGHSMGGGVTMYALVAQPDLIDAAVLFAPVHSNEYHNFHKRTQDRTSSGQVAAFEAQYGSINQTGSFLPISPENYFDRIDDPVQIHHGTADESVPLERSYDIRAAMNDVNIDVTLYEYEGGPHEFISNWEIVMERTTSFFAEHLQ